MRRRQVRLCGCGCGEELLGGRDQRYVDGAHKQASYRARCKEREAVRREERAQGLRAPDVPERDLGVLLGSLVETAQRRPGLIVLRVGGELHTLTLAELRALHVALTG